MRMRKWPIMIKVVNIMIWISHGREEFQNDKMVEGWTKIDFFNLLFFFVAHTNDSTNQLQSSVFFILNLI